MPHSQLTADAILKLETGQALTGTILAGATPAVQARLRLHTVALTSAMSMANEVTGGGYLAQVLAASAFTTTITTAAGQESVSVTTETRFPVNTGASYSVAAISEELNVGTTGAPVWVAHKYFNFSAPIAVATNAFFDMAPSTGFQSIEAD